MSSPKKMWWLSNTIVRYIFAVSISMLEDHWAGVVVGLVTCVDEWKRLRVEGICRAQGPRYLFVASARTQRFPGGKKTVVARPRRWLGQWRRKWRVLAVDDCCSNTSGRRQGKQRCVYCVLANLKPTEEEQGLLTWGQRRRYSDGQDDLPVAGAHSESEGCYSYGQIMLGYQRWASYLHARPVLSCLPLALGALLVCTDALHCMPGRVFIRSHQSVRAVAAAGVLTFCPAAAAAGSVFDTAGRNIGLWQSRSLVGGEICIGCRLCSWGNPGIWILFSLSLSQFVLQIGRLVHYSPA